MEVNKLMDLLDEDYKQNKQFFDEMFSEKTTAKKSTKVTKNKK